MTVWFLLVLGLAGIAITVCGAFMADGLPAIVLGQAMFLAGFLGLLISQRNLSARSGK